MQFHNRVWYHCTPADDPVKGSKHVVSIQTNVGTVVSTLFLNTECCCVDCHTFIHIIYFIYNTQLNAHSY
jgi:hypothetical protein